MQSLFSEHILNEHLFKIQAMHYKILVEPVTQILSEPINGSESHYRRSLLCPSLLFCDHWNLLAWTFWYLKQRLGFMLCCQYSCVNTHLHSLSLLSLKKTMPKPIIDNKNNVSSALPSALLRALPGYDDDGRRKEDNDFLSDDKLIYEGPVILCILWGDCPVYRSSG